MSLQLLMKLAVIIINFFTFSIYIFNLKNYAVYGLLQGLSSKKSACNAGDVGLFPGLGRSPGGGHGNPLHYSCLKNPMDRGAWWATVHGVTKSQTRWKRQHDKTCCM